MDHRKILTAFLYTSTIAGTLWIFWMSATFGQFNFLPVNTPSYYASLAEGFMQGQLALNSTPSPELLSLPDPYEPYSRVGVDFLWDASLYKGRYFIYFGPLPALLLYVPSSLILNHRLSDDEAIFVLTIAVVVALVVAWRFVGKRLLNVAPVGGILPWILYAAYGTNLSLQLGGGIYVVAALSATLFQIIAILLVARHLSSDQPKGKTLAFAGTCAIAAVASRPTQLITVLLCGLLLLAWDTKKRDLERALRSLFIFGLPVAIGGCAMAVYNYLRFDDIFEFGLTYQLTVASLRERAICSAKYFFDYPEIFSIQTWYLLLQPPHFVSTFPYVSFLRAEPRDFISPDGPYLGADAVTGLLWVCPLIVPGLIASLLQWRRIPVLSQLVFGMCLLCALGVLGYLYTCCFAAARYLFEIISALTIVAIPALWLACERSGSRWTRFAWRCITYAGLIAGISIGFVGTLDGHFKKGPAIRALLRGEDPKSVYKRPYILNTPHSPLETWLEEHIVRHLPIKKTQKDQESSLTSFSAF